jgi:hypothetical protein
MDSSYFWKLDPDPHYCEEMDVDPQKSQNLEALEAQIGALEGLLTSGRRFASL